ncbi:DUF1501 domain-containing protein [Schlesneria paludicola]|uniref:DUF1501 domain-containing protein n=1 Tax=Schlesneria paludicola TaxID=360056 RepID=UPI000492345E|nr:DUF1501 domain-containing protein [Schlesneria paludicola]
MPSGFPRHEQLSRRTMLQAGSIGLLGLGLNHVTALREADASSDQSTQGKAKSVIFIFLSGGLAQHDSFDPKPEAPLGIRGLFSPIATRSPGLEVCEHLPMLAARSQNWSVIRTLTTPHNEHSQGHMSILTGRTPMPPTFDPTKPMPGDWPSIASVVGDTLPRRNNNLPPAIVLPERLIHNTGRILPGQFGGQMGSRRDPWFVEASPYNPKSYGAYPDYEFHFVRGRERNPNLKFQAPNLSLPHGLDIARLGQRSELLAMLDQQRADLEQTASVANFDRHRQSAVSLLTDAQMQRAFDVHNANPRDLDRYGRNAFGWSLLMARQLVEQGVGLVQVNLGNNEAWDTHENHFPLLRDCLLPPTDRGVSALLDDLNERELLKDTLIVMCGEMGRTPKINPIGGESKIPGRDHWGAVQSVFIAGGGTPGGIVVGASDKDGAYPVKSPQRPEDLAATIYHALGIPATASWKDDQDRPHQIYSGEPIAELI